MKTENKILELEKRLAEAQKELQALKTSQAASTTLEIKDGDWLYLHCFNLSYILKYKVVDGTKDGKGGAYLAIEVGRSYGNSYRRSFFENDDIFFNLNSSDQKIRHATHEEIKQALRDFAIYKGFVEGAKYKPIRNYRYLSTPEVQTVKCMAGVLPMRFFDGKYFIYSAGSDGEDCIYYNGQWAELVKDFEIVPGYPVIFIDAQTCEINNVRYYKPEIIKLADSIDEINGPKNSQVVIKSINVGCNGQFKLTSKDLRDLLANWPFVEKK